jgi:hypothetical protein
LFCERATPSSLSINKNDYGNDRQVQKSQQFVIHRSKPVGPDAMPADAGSQKSGQDGTQASL